MATMPTLERALVKASLTLLDVKVPSFDMSTKLILSGWNVPLADAREIVAKVVASESFMAEQLQQQQKLINADQTYEIRNLHCGGIEGCTVSKTVYEGARKLRESK